MKNLRLVFNNAEGEQRDITLPMEKWIRDWWYECDFVPENGEIPSVVELDGKDILKDFPDYANSFEDIAYKYMWDGFHDDFYGDVAAGLVKDNGDAFEQWLKEHVNDMDLSNLQYALDKIRQVKDGVLKKPMDKTKYIQLCNCEKDILGAMGVINMMNCGDFDKYYNE